MGHRITSPAVFNPFSATSSPNLPPRPTSLCEAIHTHIPKTNATLNLLEWKLAQELSRGLCRQYCLVVGLVSRAANFGQLFRERNTSRARVALKKRHKTFSGYSFCDGTLTSRSSTAWRACLATCAPSHNRAWAAVRTERLREASQGVPPSSTTESLKYNPLHQSSPRCRHDI